MRNLKNWNVDTADWQSGVEVEDALGTAVNTIMNDIAEMPDDEYTALVAEFADDFAFDRVLAATLEEIGLQSMKDAGFEPGRSGCNMVLQYATDEQLAEAAEREAKYRESFTYTVKRAREGFGPKALAYAGPFAVFVHAGQNIWQDLHPTENAARHAAIAALESRFNDWQKSRKVRN